MAGKPPLQLRLRKRLLRNQRLRRLWTCTKGIGWSSGDILGALAPNHHLSGAILEARRRHGTTEATNQLAKYFSEREQPTRIPPPPRLWGRPGPVMQQTTSKALAGQIAFDGADVKWAPGQTIDWKHGELKDLFQLQRHVFLLDLLFGDAGPAKDIARYSVQFIHEWQRYNEDQFVDNPLAWNDDTAANRIQAQMSTMAFLRIHHVTERETELAFLRSLLVHAEWLHDNLNYNFRTNHGMMQDCALLEIAARYPEFDKKQRWLTRSTQRMEERLSDSVTPEGVYLELTPYYHWFATRMALWFMLVCEFAGRPLGRQASQTVRRTVAFSLATFQPDGSFPLISDTFPGKVTSSYWPWESIPAWPETAHLRGLLERRESPEYKCNSKVFFQSGYVLLRQDQNKRSADSELMCTMISGVRSVAHGHRNKLSITLYANGRPILSGPGYPPYWDMRKREQLLATTSQNTVSVDDSSQKCGDSSITFFRTYPETDNGEVKATPTVVQATSELYEGVSHRRTVLLGAALGAILLVDELHSSSTHVYRQHFRPADRLVASRGEAGRLRIAPANADHGGVATITTQCTADGNIVRPEAEDTPEISSFRVVGARVRFITIIETRDRLPTRLVFTETQLVWSGSHGSFVCDLPLELPSRIGWRPKLSD